MPDGFISKRDSEQPLIYQIRLESHLGSNWTDWFEGLTITLEENGEMLLTGPLVDQAALYGLLKKVRDLGVSLVSVQRLPFKEAQPENDEQKISSDHEEKIK